MRNYTPSNETRELFLSGVPVEVAHDRLTFVAESIRDMSGLDVVRAGMTDGIQARFARTAIDSSQTETGIQAEEPAVEQVTDEPARVHPEELRPELVSARNAVAAIHSASTQPPIIILPPEYNN